MKCQEVIEFEKYKKEHSCAFVSKTLGSENPHYYLKNRLELAFYEGFRLGRKLEKKKNF